MPPPLTTALTQSSILFLFSTCAALCVNKMELSEHGQKQSRSKQVLAAVGTGTVAAFGAFAGSYVDAYIQLALTRAGLLASDSSAFYILKGAPTVILTAAGLAFGIQRNKEWLLKKGQSTPAP